MNKLLPIVVGLPKLKKFRRSSKILNHESQLFKIQRLRVSPEILRVIENSPLIKLVKFHMDRLEKFIKEFCSDKWRKVRKGVSIWLIRLLEGVLKRLWRFVKQYFKNLGHPVMICALIVGFYLFAKPIWDFLRNISWFSEIDDDFVTPYGQIHPTILLNNLATKIIAKQLSSPRVFAKSALIGRICVVNHGEHTGKLVVIVDVIEQDLALVDAPDIVRCPMSFNRFSLTDIKIDIQKNCQKEVLINAMETADVQNDWDGSSSGRNYINQKKISYLNDFHRFKDMAAKLERGGVVSPDFHWCRKRLLG